MKYMSNSQIYDTGILFDQNTDYIAQEKFMEHYRAVFSECNIKTIHDCTIGAGGTTLPLAKLGYELTGSDLSQNLLDRAKINFNKAGYDIDLFVADLTEIDKHLDIEYDCIISTGNSLPHVNIEGFRDFVESASSKLKKDGYIYFDIRNWDKLLQEKKVFQSRDPFTMTNSEHRSLYLISTWHDDKYNSVTFNFITSIDKDGKHVSSSNVTVPRYYPLLREDFTKILNDYGFEIQGIFNMDELWHIEADSNNAEMQWYSVLAKRTSTPTNKKANNIDNTEIKLHFHLAGKCLEAIDVYKDAFSADITTLIKNDDSPQQVVHAEMQIHNQTVTFSDYFGGTQHASENSVLHLTVYFDSETELKETYGKIEEGSTTIRPFSNVGYSSCMIDFTDRFGVRWAFLTRR